MYNDNFLNAIELASFVIGIANYKENLTQNDKDDIMRKFDKQTQDILNELRNDIAKQNEMLKEILEKLEG